MRYLGGKVRIGPRIATVLVQALNGRDQYVEPFVGSTAVAEQVAKRKPVTLLLADISLDLILLFQALQEGWQPPGRITEQEYVAQRDAEPSALRGFVGFGCSWGGKFFGGYARKANPNRHRGDQYIEATVPGDSKISLLRAILTLSAQRATFVHSDYRELSIPDNALIYCDPPYVNRTSYGFDFDHEIFWQQVRDWSAQGHKVIVSEESAPSDFKEIWAYRAARFIGASNLGQKRSRMEYLFELVGI